MGKHMQIRLFLSSSAVVLLLNGGCKIGDVGYPSEDVPAGKALLEMKNVEAKAKAINATAYQLESMVDEARRRIDNGEDKKTVLEEMRTQLQAVQQNQKELRDALIKLERHLTIHLNNEKDQND